MVHDKKPMDHRPIHRTIQIPGSISLGGTMEIGRAVPVTEKKPDAGRGGTV